MSSQLFAALNTYVQRVRDYLTAHGCPAAVGFGWYQTAEQDNVSEEDGSRVIFEPADGVNAGKLGPIRGGPGWSLETMPDNTQMWVRPIYGWERVFNVYVWAAPPCVIPATQEEALALPGLQEEANAELFEVVIRAIRAAGSVWAQPGGISFIKADTQKQIGREMKLQITLSGNIMDIALAPGTPDPDTSGIPRP